jgi:hypothetical protein
MLSLVSVAEAAHLLGTTAYHVTELCRSGVLPCGSIEGLTVIPMTAVQQYAERVSIALDTREPIGASRR